MCGARETTKARCFYRADVANERMKWLCPAGWGEMEKTKRRVSNLSIVSLEAASLSGFRWLPNCLLARTCCFNLANWAEILSAAAAAAGTTVFRSVGRRERNALMEYIFLCTLGDVWSERKLFSQFPFSNICRRQWCFIKNFVTSVCMAVCRETHGYSLCLAQLERYTKGEINNNLILKRLCQFDLFGLLYIVSTPTKPIFVLIFQTCLILKYKTLCIPSYSQCYKFM